MDPDGRRACRRRPIPHRSSAIDEGQIGASRRRPFVLGARRARRPSNALARRGPRCDLSDRASARPAEADRDPTSSRLSHAGPRDAEPRRPGHPVQSLIRRRSRRPHLAPSPARPSNRSLGRARIRPATRSALTLAASAQKTQTVAGRRPIPIPGRDRPRAGRLAAPRSPSRRSQTARTRGRGCQGRGVPSRLPTHPPRPSPAPMTAVSALRGPAAENSRLPCLPQRNRPLRPVRRLPGSTRTSTRPSRATSP